jgi:hypothetical protein
MALVSNETARLLDRAATCVNTWKWRENGSTHTNTETNCMYAQFRTVSYLRIYRLYKFSSFLTENALHLHWKYRSVSILLWGIRNVSKMQSILTFIQVVHIITNVFQSLKNLTVPHCRHYSIDILKLWLCLCLYPQMSAVALFGGTVRCFPWNAGFCTMRKILNPQIFTILFIRWELIDICPAM